MSQASQRTLLILGSIVVIALGAVLILSSIGTPSVPTTTAPRSTAPVPSAPTASADIPYPEIVRVSLGNAKAAYDLKQAVFLDVRDAGSYANSHIPGAISIPLADLETRLGELNKTAWIITYCT